MPRNEISTGLRFVIALSMLFAGALPLSAQAPPGKPKPDAKAPGATKSADGKKPATKPDKAGKETPIADTAFDSAPAPDEPRKLMGRDLITPDGVQLVAEYYPGKMDRDTVPIILLHGQARTRAEFAPLLDEFKARGFAVLAVDLRGHGESTKKWVVREAPPSERPMQPPMMNMPIRDQRGKKIAGPKSIGGPLGPPRGGMPIPQDAVRMEAEEKLVDYKADAFTPEDWSAMLNNDLVPLIRFLAFEHSQKRVNLAKLCIIGTDMGAAVATSWASGDWRGAHPTRTKVVVLISPRDEEPLRDIIKGNKKMRDEVAFLTLVGRSNDSKYNAALDLKNAYFGKKPEAEDLGLESKFPVIAFPTEMQGGELLAKSEFNIPKILAQYIEEKLAPPKKDKPKAKPAK